MPAVEAPPRDGGTTGRRGAGPSLRPALVVVGLALLIVVLGGVLALAGTRSARPLPAGAGPARTVPGSSIKAQSARLVLSHVASDGEPPADVVDSLAVPAGASYLRAHDYDRGVAPFDRAVVLRAGYRERAVERFYVRLLSEEHWTVTRLGNPAGGRTDLVAEKSASDGYEWRVVLVLTSEHGAVSPALAGGGSSAVATRVELALYEVEDAS